jgi:hypothetical protein
MNRLLIGLSTGILLPSTIIFSGVASAKKPFPILNCVYPLSRDKCSPKPPVIPGSLGTGATCSGQLIIRGKLVVVTPQNLPGAYCDRNGILQYKP